MDPTTSKSKRYPNPKLVDVKGLIAHKFKLDVFEKALQTVDNVAEKP